MFGLIKDILNTSAEITGTILGVAITPIAIALNVSESMVKKAVRAGCKTQREIQEWIEKNP